MSNILEDALKEAVITWELHRNKGNAYANHPIIEIVDGLVPHLDTDAIISRLCSMHQYGLAERTHTKLTPHIVAANLILRATHIRPEEAIRELHILVLENKVSASVCALIAGISVDTEVVLCANTKIRPFRYNLLPPGIVSVRHPFPGMMIDGCVSDPSAILVLEVPHQPFFEVEQAAPDWPTEKVTHLLEVADRLSVASYRAVGVTEMWITDEDPRLPSQGGVMSFRNPHWNAPPNVDPVEITKDIVDFVSLFDNVLASAERATLKLAAARFNRSCRAISSTDRSLDIGMALEILLMHQGKGSDSSNSEISYKLASRAAWMLGENLEERLDYFRRVSSLYADRSSAVHKGRIDTKDLLQVLEPDSELIRNEPIV